MAETTEKLIKEYSKNRETLYKLVSDIEDMAKTAKSIIPDTTDYKSKFIVAERLDIATRLYDTVLKFRSEIAKQIKEEINLSDKIQEEDDPLDWINNQDIE